MPIDGYCHLYLVSSHGRIKALDRYVTEKTGLKRFHAGRLITPKKTGAYLGVSLFEDGKGKRFYIHRLVAMAFIPNPFNKPCVNHRNFNACDNRIQNLEWTTYKENTDWSVAAGRITANLSPKGIDCPHSKLDNESVRTLRLTWTRGSSMQELVQKYGVSSAAIYKVLCGRTWKHVEPVIAVNWAQ